MSKTDDINSPDLIEMKDTEKYARQVGSKALIMTDRNIAIEYEAKRAAALRVRNAQTKLEERVEGLEEKIDKILDFLTSNMPHKVT